MNEKLSAPVQFVKLVWANAQGQDRHYGRIESYSRLNSSLQDALSLAITSGMIFKKGDFEYIAGHFGFEYWCGNDGHMSGERYYSRAVWSGNISACQSFEAWKKRKPFVFVNVSHGWDPGIEERLKIRLVIRSKFRWNGEDVEVTSFAEDGGCLVACSYHDKKTYPTKIRHQYKITWKDLQNAMRRIKRQKEIKEKLGINFRPWSTFTTWVVDLFELTFSGDQKTEEKFYAMFQTR